MNDDLSWLIYPEMMDLDPPTQVSNTADVNSETSVSAPSHQSTPMTTTEHPESTSVEVNLNHVLFLLTLCLVIIVKTDMSFLTEAREVFLPKGMTRNMKINGPDTP